MTRLSSLKQATELAIKRANRSKLIFFISGEHIPRYICEHQEDIPPSSPPGGPPVALELVQYAGDQPKFGRQPPNSPRVAPHHVPAAHAPFFRLIASSAENRACSGGSIRKEGWRVSVRSCSSRCLQAEVGPLVNTWQLHS